MGMTGMTWGPQGGKGGRWGVYAGVAMMGTIWG